MEQHMKYHSILGILAAGGLLVGCTGRIERGVGGPSPAGGVTPRTTAVPGGGQSTPGPGASGDPGRATLRRLNRPEYNNTVRDLLGTALRPADDFPPDPEAFGFDNNGDVQNLGATQIDQYQTAADTLINEATASGLDRIAAAARTAICDPTRDAACGQRILTGFAGRAWRRPATAPEIDRLLGVARAAASRGDDPLSALRLALVAVLSAPQFLFRLEPDPDPASRQAWPLDGYQLASRLSYLIYRSMPDDPLRAAAGNGQLRTAADVRREALRMLADPKGSELVAGFAGQWLDLEDLPQHEVDPTLFGKVFDTALAQSMRAETMQFVAELLRQNLPLSTLLDARFGFADARLAQLYGVAAPASKGLARFDLPANRAGILTQAAVLTATSPADRTSPVVRGAWVLGRLLCAPPPPPPPDVPPLPMQTTTATTQRALLAIHRQAPACGVCHNLIDPIGLGLENYDGIGRWRDTDGGAAIDASGALPDGSAFHGAVELAGLLSKDPRVSSCLAGNLYTYALGRRPDNGATDGPQLGGLLRGADSGTGPRLQDLVLALVTSDAFRLRQPEGAGGRP
jgi:hypothetical protein